MLRLKGLFAASGAVLALVFGLLPTPPALAEARVGVAAAITPEATSVPPGAPPRILKIGKSILFNERIDTSGTGVVQVLLVDGSTFTVGPNSNLVIDKFVYDPGRGEGELVASFIKGALRFIGGKLSKPVGGIQVKTPAGELTVRGGMFQGVVTGPNQAFFSFLFGNELSLRRHGQTYRLTDTGMTIDVHGPGAPSLHPTLAGETVFTLASVSGHKWKGIMLVEGPPFPHFYGIHPIGWQDYPHRYQNIIWMGTQDQVRNGLTRVPVSTPPITRPNICGIACTHLP